MTRPVQTGFTFPLGVFDRRPPAAAPVPGSNQLVHGQKSDDVSVPELRTVYDDDQRPPGIDAEDEPDPEGE